MSKETRHYEGMTKAEALQQVVNEFPAAVVTDFEFDDATETATFNVRAIPVMAIDPVEAEESRMLNKTIESYNVRTEELDERERELNKRENALEKLEKKTKQRIKEAEKIEKRVKKQREDLEKRVEGYWQRIKSKFHGIN